MGVAAHMEDVPDTSNDPTSTDEDATSLLERARRLGQMAAERAQPAPRRWMIDGYELSEGEGGLWWVRDMKDRHRSFPSKPAALGWIRNGGTAGET